MLIAFFKYKLEFLITFISSFSFGLMFVENQQVISNFIGSIIATVIIRLFKNLFKKNKK